LPFLTPKHNNNHSTQAQSITTTSSHNTIQKFYNDIETVVDEVQNRAVVEDDSEPLDFSTQLIIEVQKRRPLWDARLPKADRYPSIVNRLWTEIISGLNCKN